MGDIEATIQDEISRMTDDEIERELAKLIERKKKQRERSLSPESKARRREYYDKVRNTPEWKEQRRIQAAKRKAKEEALLKHAKATMDAGQLKELGLA